MTLEHDEKIKGKAESIYLQREQYESFCRGHNAPPSSAMKMRFDVEQALERDRQRKWKRSDQLAIPVEKEKSLKQLRAEAKQLKLPQYLLYCEIAGIKKPE